MSSANDMTKWLNFHLSGGKNDKGQQVVDPSLVSQLHLSRFRVSKTYTDIEKPQYPITSMSPNYALGVKIGHYRGYRLISHTGTTTGFTSYMTLLPTQNIGIVSLFSGEDKYYRHRTAVNHFLLDSALGVTPYLNKKTMCSFPRPWTSKKLDYFYAPSLHSKLQFLYKTYEGTYSHPAYGTIEIKHDTTRHALVMKYGWGNWELYPRKYRDQNKEQRFYAKGIAPVYPTDLTRIHFIAHPSKSGTVIAIRGTSFQKNLPPIFCRSKYLGLCKEVISRTMPEWTSVQDYEGAAPKVEGVTNAFYRGGNICKTVCFDLPNGIKEDSCQNATDLGGDIIDEFISN